MGTLLQDLRYTLRALLRSPGFALVATLTLALGIGATTAIFSVVHAVLLAPLPYPQAERLVVPHTVSQTGERWSVSYADFLDWERERVFAHVALYDARSDDLAGEGEPQRVQSAAVSRDFLATLGVRPALGRGLGPQDYAPGAEPVVVLGHRLWQSRFGGSAAVVGRTVRLSGTPTTVVGVLPPEARLPETAELWRPLVFRGGGIPPAVLERDNYQFQAVARLRPGSTTAAAGERLAELARRVAADDPTRAGVSLAALPLAEWTVGADLPRLLWVLFGAVGLVLLIGCVNIANLLLVRASARRGEFAVRASLGATRGRLVRQVLTESLVLGALGGAAGVLVALAAVDLLRAAAPADIPRLEGVRVNGAALAFALAVSLLAAAGAGVAPALGASRLAGVAGARTTAAAAARRSRRLLVVGELALSLVLLVGAGLAVRSLGALRGTDPGFAAEGLVTMSVHLPRAQYEGDAAVAAFYDGVLGRVRELPGVRAASISSALPVGGGGLYLGRAFLAEGWAEPPAGPEVSGMWNVVGDGYFRTSGIALQRGRDFTAADDSASTPVMIVNEAFARQLFPGQDPVGRRVRSWRDENVLREIVGVVRDVRYFSAGDSIRPLVYVPFRQDVFRNMAVTVRTAGDPGAVVPAIRRAVAALNPDIAVADVATMTQLRDASMARPRFGAVLLSGFGVVALVLASVGVYGVLAYAVARRTHEIGVRMALGARGSDVRRMVVGEAAHLAALGIGAGLLGALAVSRVMQSLLYGVSATDPAAFAAGPLVLGAVALLAGYLPARRASRVDPVTALRAE